MLMDTIFGHVQTKWKKIDGLEVKPPVYDKKVGRPKKCGRK